MSEHAVFTKFFNKIEQVLPDLNTLAEAKLLGGLVEELLREHGDTETDLAYVALDHALDHDGKLDQLYEDHHEIDNCLRKVQSATSRSEAVLLLKTAISSSRKHFQREEQLIFPLLERMLQSETLSVLGSSWVEQRRSHASAIR